MRASTPPSRRTWALNASATALLHGVEFLLLKSLTVKKARATPLIVMFHDVHAPDWLGAEGKVGVVHPPVLMLMVTRLAVWLVDDTSWVIAVDITACWLSIPSMMPTMEVMTSLIIRLSALRVSTSAASDARVVWLDDAHVELHTCMRACNRWVGGPREQAQGGGFTEACTVHTSAGVGG